MVAEVASAEAVTETETKAIMETEAENVTEKGMETLVFTGEPYHATMPTEAEEAEIYVEPVEGLSEDFIKGMDISGNYRKEVAVLETSYAYTTEDGDGFADSVSDVDLVDGYAATVQSQANCVRDVMAATAAAGDAALGVFYWEGAWIPVGSAENLSENEKIWEEHGSGWASSYSAKYDPNDAGQYYGGCSWDNQAMFDFTGDPLASLNVFKYVNYGTNCELKIDYIEDSIVNVNVGEELVMPEMVEFYHHSTLSSYNKLKGA